MDQPISTTPEHGLARTGDEMEERLGRLDDHIGDARQRLEARREEAPEDSDDSEDESQGSDVDFDDPEAPEADDDEDEDEDEDE